MAEIVFQKSVLSVTTKVCHQRPNVAINDGYMFETANLLFHFVGK
jgi:hypothetical protein